MSQVYRVTATEVRKALYLYDKKRERRNQMEDTDSATLQKAIGIYRDREGDTAKTFDMFKLESIITELKEAKKTKTKGKK